MGHIVLFTQDEGLDALVEALQARGAVRSAVDPAGRVAVVLETRAGRTAFVGRRGAELSLLVRSLPGLVVDPVRSFGFAWSVTFDPPDADADDRMDVVWAIARGLRGSVFTPIGLHDPDGRLLAYVGADDSAAPTAREIALQACVLAALARRGFVERGTGDREAMNEEILSWISATRLERDFHGDPEHGLPEGLYLATGSWSEDDIADACLGLEGVAVLLWALGRFEVPPSDVAVDPGAVFGVVGAFHPDRARTLIDTAQARDPTSIAGMGVRLRTAHWRLTHWNRSPGAIDLGAVGDPLFGLDVRGIRMIDGDMAIGDVPIAHATADDIQHTERRAEERHRAVNWLLGFDELYSEVIAPT